MHIGSVADQLPIRYDSITGRETCHRLKHMSDYHHESLARLEAQQAREDREAALIEQEPTTYWVRTAKWTECCTDDQSLGEAVRAAIQDGLAFQVEDRPF